MSNNLTTMPEWIALQKHAQSLRQTHMNGLFREDSRRSEKFNVRIKGLSFDYSRHLATTETLNLLLDLAKVTDVASWRTKLFEGGKINTTEGRAALHTALRGSGPENLVVDGENTHEFVHKTLGKIEFISGKIRNDRTITDVVNIGIGGSDLGPRIVHETLRDFNTGPRVHFVSNVDGARITSVLKSLKPSSTVFIVTSKTFSTMETLTNARTAKEWAKTTKNFHAITMNIESAREFEVPEENILTMQEWTGGRVSLWSAAGLSIAIAAGFENFKNMLAGAHGIDLVLFTVDNHFLTSPPDKNIPVLMALLGIWYRNFWDYRAHAILPYAHDLRKFPAYVQQLDMESNGKSVSRDGISTNYKTGPLVFGETGTNAQHAFMQFLHQGTDIIPADFIIIKHAGHTLADHHRKLNTNALAQAQALMQGRKNTARPYQRFDGNRPSSTLILDRIDPWHIGLLLALYEHRMFVQGIVWNINSFDQWGVELGKTLASEFLERGTSAADQTTVALMQILEG